MDLMRILEGCKEDPFKETKRILERFFEDPFNDLCQDPYFGYNYYYDLTRIFRQTCNENIIGFLERTLQIQVL